MKKALIIVALLGISTGLFYWRERYYKAEHINGTQIKIEYPETGESRHASCLQKHW